jgi:HEAT repeat protein
MGKWLIGLFLGVAFGGLLWAPLLGLRAPVCFQASAPVMSLDVPPPDLPQLAAAAAMNGGGALSEAQLDEERQIETDQVAAARESLLHADEQERVSGAEQLSAYPTLEAETALRDALLNDASLAVRAAAAESLGKFRRLRQETVQALARTLRDGDEAVSYGALSALQGFVYRPDVDVDTSNRVLRALKAAAKDGMVNSELREAINDVLMDQPD